MLGAMDIAVGVLLAVAGLVLVGLVAALVARRRAAPPPAPTATADQADDLQAFLESPPGSRAPTRSASEGVVALAAPPVPAAPPPPPPRRPVPTAVLAALAGLVVLLLVAAAVVAMASTGAGRGNGEGRGADAVASDQARLRFAGIVLEERAVGVTVSYPELVLEAGGDGPVAFLELLTWNCLAADAPQDPVEAGCAAGRTEYAELRSPALQVAREDDGLRITGAFATATRSTGGDPEPTGRTYDVVVTVQPEGTAIADRWVPASGELELGGRRTALVEGELRVHR